ncbi:MAG: BlaI/MecI/CopY family transcriptional regulator [Bacteroidales bacterium]|nr:BlaI/MecI/CopY family transcriptional regulator [Bacteroidales bacterium]MBD5229012.1 BlaI/MecI/CopY family transcriptional regulator [Bacteroidales bacterium]MBD5235261.1 BlaI/MecI/CopY family transcriptional regulator [Barnesiella sp.]MBD5247556.1 BlaI/MecI/CopY family transcriptional regulator [Barnesiella sp.]
MRKSTPKDQLTDKEEELMRMLWEHGPMFVSQLLELYPEPKPHFNTVSTVIRRLESKGIVAHNDVSGSYQYYPVAERETYGNRSLGRVIKSYFKGSYYGAVSALVAEEKISADELRELLELVEQKSKK